MIIECNVSIKEILEQGKKFKWVKPDICPCCKDSVLWGHGVVLCFFAHFISGIYLKRYRCNSCSSVIKLKPLGFFKRFQTPINTIRKSIRERLTKKQILYNSPRANQDYWLRNLKKNVRVILGEKWKHRLLDGFDKLLLEGQIPVSISIRNIP
jgi:hypothetical protein